MSKAPDVLVLKRIRSALNDMGPYPDVHREAVAHLRTTWPTLFNALMLTLDEDERIRLGCR